MDEEFVFSISSDLDNGYRGYAAGPFFDCHELAEEVFGDTEANGLVLFAYLWRRFGPPWFGCDPHKELAGYFLTTRIDGLLLNVSCKAMELPYCFAVMYYFIMVVEEYLKVQ